MDGTLYDVTGLGTFSFAALLTMVNPSLSCFNFASSLLISLFHFSISTIYLFALSRGFYAASPHLLFVINCILPLKWNYQVRRYAK